MTPKKSNAIDTNNFCEKNALKSSNFEDKIDEITLFKQ